MRGSVVLLTLAVVLATVAGATPSLTTGSPSDHSTRPDHSSQSDHSSRPDHSTRFDHSTRPDRDPILRDAAEPTPAGASSSPAGASSSPARPSRSVTLLGSTTAIERTDAWRHQSEAGPSLSVRLAHTQTPPRSPLALRRALFEERFERAGQVATDTTFVITLTSRTLAAQIESRDGNATERFFTAVDGRRMPVLALIEQDPGPQRDPDVATFGPANTTVVRDGPRTYLLVNASRLRFDDGPGTPRDGSTYTVRFAYAGREASSRPVRLFAQPAELSGFRSYDPLPPERVRLPASVFVPPEEAVLFRLSLPNRTITAPVEASAGQTPGADLDLRDVPPGTPYTLRLVHDNRTITSVGGVVRPPDAEVRNVTVTRRGDQLLVNATVRLSHGGALRVRDETGTVIIRQPFGPVFGVANEPNESVRVTLRTFETDVERVTVEALREPGAATFRYPNATVTVNVSQPTDRLVSSEARDLADRHEVPSSVTRHERVTRETACPARRGS